ncbi:MAG: aminotransferase class IV [Bacteroidetes bacterium]|nr:MAG: aminotransferase class IV [Bacteroidota bacterium]
MGKNIIYNGVLLDRDNFSLSLMNRSFRYGDGVFETIRCRNSNPLWWSYHFARLQRSAEVLRIELPESFSQQVLENQIQELLKSNGFTKGARLRLSLFRTHGGFYKPQNNKGEYIVEAEKLENESYTLNKLGLNLGVYTELSKSCNFLGGIKSSSSILYVLASLYAAENKWDDVVILNETGHVAEATSSNLFMVTGDKLYTPDLDQACVDGVMRKVILDIGSKYGYNVSECAILPDDLLKADEVFITNAIRGIQWVKGIKNKRYYHEVSSGLIAALEKESEAL